VAVTTQVRILVTANFFSTEIYNFSAKKNYCCLKNIFLAILALFSILTLKNIKSSLINDFSLITTTQVFAKTHLPLLL